MLLSMSNHYQTSAPPRQNGAGCTLTMHKHLTHNKCYATYREFAEATLEFLRETVPIRWFEFRDSVTDNFRVIDPKDFRVLT